MNLVRKIIFVIVLATQPVAAFAGVLSTCDVMAPVQQGMDHTVNPHDHHGVMQDAANDRPAAEDDCCQDCASMCATPAGSSAAAGRTATEFPSQGRHAVISGQVSSYVSPATKPLLRPPI